MSANHEVERANAHAILEALRLRNEVSRHKDDVADSQSNSDNVQARIRELLGK